MGSFFCSDNSSLGKKITIKGNVALVLYYKSNVASRNNASFTIVIENGRASASLNSNGVVGDSCSAAAEYRAYAENITITSITVE